MHAANCVAFTLRWLVVLSVQHEALSLVKKARCSHQNDTIATERTLWILHATAWFWCPWRPHIDACTAKISPLREHNTINVTVTLWRVVTSNTPDTERGWIAAKAVSSLPLVRKEVASLTLLKLFGGAWLSTFRNRDCDLRKNKYWKRNKVLPTYSRMLDFDNFVN